MSKNRKSLLRLLLALAACTLFTGCSLQGRIEERADDKEPCYLDAENVTQFSYKGGDYSILADTASEPGQWAGYIRQLAAVDENGKILLQEDMEAATFRSLADLGEKAPEAAYIIPFLNVYTAPDDDSQLLVDVNGEYHRALASEKVRDSDALFDFREKKAPAAGSFTLDPENATRLLCEGAAYQVRSAAVSEDELGDFLAILAENVTFDTQTKRPLSKEELSRVDWSGQSAAQGRESWFYTDVYEIDGTDTAKAVAVKVNGLYHVAERQPEG